MFFGALASGFDMAPGHLAQAIATTQYPNSNLSFIYKDVHINFIKRADGDVHFVCNDGVHISECMRKAIEGKERLTTEVNVIAYVPSKSTDTPVATATLKLSMKVRS